MSREHDQDFNPVTHFDATDSYQEINAISKRDKVADILYSPNYNAFVVLTESELAAIELSCAPFTEALNALEQAKQDLADNPNSGVAKKQLAQKQQEAAEKLKPIMTGSGATGNSWLELHRVHKAKDVIYAPGRILNPKDPSKSRTFYFLTDEPEGDENAFKSFRDKDGRIDKKKLREAFQKTAFNIKAEWELAKRSGQVPTRVFVGAFSPALAKLLNNELDVLDEWIAEVNKALKWQSEQYASDKEKALTLLAHTATVPLTFENFGHAKLLCREIWNDVNPLENIDFIDFNPDTKSNRNLYDNKIKEIKTKELPPAIWQASAEANLMRWKASAKAGFEFDLKKGVLAAEANAEFDFALAEGKLAGSLFYPHDEGIHAKLTVNTKSKHQKWRPFIGAFDETDRVHFNVDSEFLTIRDIKNLSDAFAHWELLKKTVDNQYRLTVIGHTSLTGPSDYNMRLSARRAAMVYGFLTRNEDMWQSMFDKKIWGDAERKQMQEIVAQYHYSPFREQPISLIQFGNDDRQLIRNYFTVCENYFGFGIGNIPELIPAEFATDYLIAKGELEPVINTVNEEKQNRRVEFVLLEPGAVTEKDKAVSADFGYFRLQFEGHVSAWAGINAGISGKVEVNCAGGQMRFTDRIGAEAGVNAFAGAKAEAGLAAALDWKKPAPNEPRPKPEDFDALGTVGYLVQGQAGIGADGSFTIGYSREIQRFVIQAKASLCIGLGGGGKFEFSVDAKQVWNFIRLVYDQLYNADFNFVDVFEDKVYERFCDWSEELIKQGLWFQGLALKSGIESANLAVKLAEHIGQLADGIVENQTESNNLYELIKQIKEEPEQLMYAPPEVKGRILYRLIFQDGNFWNDFSFRGWQEDREDAVFLLLSQGVKTRREYREVLEHMLPTSVAGRSEEQKHRHASKMQSHIVIYMRDDEDRDNLMSWWEALPDPSDCSCGNSSQRINPFY